MRNVRYTIRLISAFLAKFKFIILLGVLSGLLIFFLLTLYGIFFGGRKVSRVALVGRYTVEKLPDQILNLVGDGLTQIDEKGDVSPNLAKSWETPDRGKTWLFYLNDNLYWQDEKMVVSQDINYKFEDLEIEKPDNKTLIFKLKDPYSAFPFVVSKPIFKKGLLGTGEWEVKSISFSLNYLQKIVLENKDKDRIVYKFYPTEERAKLAFKLGEVDEVRGLINPDPINNWKRVNVVGEVNKGEYIGIFLNTQDPLLSDKTLRQSLAYAINKDSIDKNRAISPISEDSWAFNPQVKPYIFNLAKAKEGIKEGTNISLTTSPLLLPVAEKIVKDWQSVGLTTEIRVISTIPENYQALLAIFDIPEDPDQYTIWHSTQVSTNITKYSNPRIDKLLEDGRTEVNLEERRKIYLDFQRFLVEDSPAIFLYYPTTYIISRQ